MKFYNFWLLTYWKIDNKILFYLKVISNCFRDSSYEKEFGNVKILTIAPKISSFGVIMGYLLKARFPNHKSGDGWSPRKKPIDGTSEESDRLPGCLSFICGRFAPICGSFRSIGTTLWKEGGGNGYLLSPLMTSTYLFPVLCVSMFAINDYYPPHGVKFIQG